MVAWLDAFNSGDAARVKEFVERYKDPQGFRIANFREETGGFRPGSRSRRASRAASRSSSRRRRARRSRSAGCAVDGDPAVIESFTVVAIPPGKTAADIRIEIDAKTPARIVDANREGAETTRTFYPELAKEMEQAIRQHLAHGDDKAIATGPDLASALTHQLQEVSHDRHVRVEWLPQIRWRATATRATTTRRE